MTARTQGAFASHPVASTQSVDEAKAVLSDTFLPIEFPTLAGSDDLHLELNALKTGRMTLGFMRFDRPIRISTAEPENYHVDIPLQGKAGLQAAHGRRVAADRHTAGVFMPGRAVDLDCGEDFAQVALMISRTELQNKLEELVDWKTLSPVQFDDALDLTAGGRTLLHAVRTIDDASQEQDGMLQHPLAVHSLEQTVLHALLFTHQHNHSEALRGHVQRAGPRAVHEAVALLRSDPARAWTVSDLAAACSTSTRSLQEGFRKTHDSTPTAYLRRLRLEKVHEELLTATPDTATISETATKWGFTHLGRFALAYSTLFAEKPSETLRA